MSTDQAVHLSEDEAFLRQFVVPAEDRHLFTTAPWSGGYRWFRSPNVVPIERWRRSNPRPAAESPSVR